MTSTAEVRKVGLTAFVIGAAVAVGLGAYGAIHDPSQKSTFSLIFSGSLEMKVWLTTIAVLLAVVQLVTALRMYGRIPFPAEPPEWFGQLHRLSGTLAFVVTVPVAYSCLWTFGFNGGHEDGRTLVHSLAGCIFYGALASKIFVLRSRESPRLLLPVLGGTVFTALVVLFFTGSVWFWSDSGFPSF